MNGPRKAKECFYYLEISTLALWTVDHLFYNCSSMSACHGKLSRQLHKDKPTAAVIRDELMMSS